MVVGVRKLKDSSLMRRPAKWIILISTANVLSFLPITIAGIGTRESVLLFFFAKYGLVQECAITYSLLFFTSTYLLFGIVGLGCFMTLNRH